MDLLQKGSLAGERTTFQSLSPRKCNAAEILTQPLSLPNLCNSSALTWLSQLATLPRVTDVLLLTFTGQKSNCREIVLPTYPSLQQSKDLEPGHPRFQLVTSSLSQSFPQSGITLQPEAGWRKRGAVGKWGGEKLG